MEELEGTQMHNAYLLLPGCQLAEAVHNIHGHDGVGGGGGRGAQVLPAFMADDVESIVYAVFHVCTGRPDWGCWRGGGNMLDWQ
jgi:hypothetical protein